MTALLLVLLGCTPPPVDNPYAADDDGDGLSDYDGDCDDADATIGLPATGCDDADSDGYRPVDGDCDDGDAQVSPAASEICGNGVDDDCDGYAAGCGAWSPRSIRESEVQYAGSAAPGELGFGTALTAGDLDRDGASDLIVASRSGGVRVFLGPLEAGRHFADLAELHFDLDDATDLAVGFAGERSFLAAGAEDGLVHIFTDLTEADTGELVAATNVIGDNSLSGDAEVAVGDLDGDGLHDLVYAVAGKSTVAIVPGPPSGNEDWSDSALFVEGASRDELGSCASIFDLDQDGYGDLFLGAPDVYTDEGQGAVYGFSGPVSADPNPTEAAWQVLGDTARPGRRCWAGPDIDIDGEPDLLIGTKLVDEIQVLSGLAPGTHAFSEGGSVLPALSAQPPFVVSAARASSDALPRIITVGTFQDGEDTRSAAWLFHGPFDPGTPDPDAITYVDDERTAPATGAALADLDDDGLIDFIVGFGAADDGRGRVGVFLEGEGP